MKRKTHSEELNFLTITVIDWIDVFTKRIYSDFIIGNLDYCRKEKGLNIFAFVLMTNHLHLIVKTEEYLPDTLRDFKTFTSKGIIKLIAKNPSEGRQKWMLDSFLIAGQKNKANAYNQFWQNGNHPVALYSNKVIQQKVDYIHDNPVRAGFVDDPTKFYYSSANPKNPLGITLT